MSTTSKCPDPMLRLVVQNTGKYVPGLQLFDVVEGWDKVRPILHDPAVLKELDAGMSVSCQKIHATWDRKKGPWHYSILPWQWVPGLGQAWEDWLQAQSVTSRNYEAWREDHEAECMEWIRAHRPVAPERDSLQWFQAFGLCGALAYWEHAIASRLWPTHLWKIYPSWHPCGGDHVFVLGWPRKRRDFVRVFDVLWQPTPRWAKILGEMASDTAARLIESYT
jgi:hypothetical protein